jgi:hypothetical protein
MDTYQLLEEIKELEAELQRLKAEQEAYRKIIMAKHKEQALTLDAEPQLPFCISEWIRRHTIHELAEDEQNTSKDVLQKHLEEAVRYICSCK